MKRFQAVAFGIALGLVTLIGSARSASAVPHPAAAASACPECGQIPLCDPNDPKCTMSDR